MHTFGDAHLYRNHERPGARAARPRAAAAAAPQARRRRLDLRPQRRRDRVRGLRPVAGDQGQGRGVSASAAGPGRGGRAQRRHRLGPRTSLAAFERPEAVQGADLGQAHGDGTQDLSHDRPSAARARDDRRHPRSRLRRAGRPRRPRSRGRARSRRRARPRNGRERSRHRRRRRDLRPDDRPRPSRLFITEVALDAKGETRFPPIDPRQWREVRREKGERGLRDEADFAFVEYERRETIPS